MQQVTYSDIAARYGHDKAYGLLKSIEQLSCPENTIIYFDRDLRFERAFQALCEAHFAG